MSNLYSGALSLGDAMPNIGYRTGLVVVAVIGSAVAALRFSQWMLPYLSTMALVASPLIALCWLTRRAATTLVDWRGPGVAAWGLGAAVGLSLNALGASYALPVGAAVTALCAVGLVRGVGADMPR